MKVPFKCECGYAPKTPDAGHRRVENCVSYLALKLSLARLDAQDLEARVKRLENRTSTLAGQVYG